MKSCSSISAKSSSALSIAKMHAHVADDLAKLLDELVDFRPLDVIRTLLLRSDRSEAQLQMGLHMSWTNRSQVVFELRYAAVIAAFTQLAQEHGRRKLMLAGALESVEQLWFKVVELRCSRLARAVLAITLPAQGFADGIS